jgi:hypothetical protein
MSAIRNERIPVNTITTVPQVLKTLRELNVLLKNNDLEQWQLFNQAYIIVTEAVDQAAGADYFTNQAFVAKFSVCFAKYYFRAVNDELQHSKTTVVAWHKLTELTGSPSSIHLLMGANAHINRDLPLALAEALAGEESKELFEDVRKVDKLLMQSGEHIIDSFEEPGRIAHYVQRHLRFLYYRPIMGIILVWRISAWQNYKKILAGKGGNQEARSTTIANRLLGLAKVAARIP